MLLEANRSFLLLVDLQQRLLPKISEHEVVTANAVKLGRAAKLLKIPVVVTEQNPERLGANAPEITELGEKTLTKVHFDATREPAWGGLEPMGRDWVVVAGCEAHVCVLQTVAGLLRRGFVVSVVSDAVGSRDPANKAAAMQRAERLGASIITSEMAIFEWLEACTHPRFRDCLRLVR